jgi:hypothetical protein
MYIENVVIGKPIVPGWTLLASDEDDWKNIEESKTLFTEERFLPKILVSIGIFKSNSEVKRNRPDLFKSLDKLDFIKIKINKRKLWIVVGE